MKKFLKYLSLILFLAIISYFSLSYILIFFPKQADSNKVKDKTIYILYSPIHTDIVFNIHDLKQTSLKEFQNRQQGYLSFGWGEKEIYMNTATLSEIKLLSSLKALFINTPSILHVAYYPNILHYKDVKKINLSQEQFSLLETSILNDFNPTTQAHRGFSKNDFFYTAKDSYNLIHTCNTWTGDKLREANISMSYWTPLSQNVTASLP